MKRLLLQPVPSGATKNSQQQQQRQLSEAVCRYQAPGRTVLCFYERQIDFDQIRIKSADVPPDTQELYLLVLANQCRAASALDSDIVRVRRMSRIEWLALRTPGPSERHLRLCTLEKNTLHVSGSVAAVNNTLTLSTSMLARSTEVSRIRLPELDSLTELWPVRWLASANDCARCDLTPMLNVICDYTLMQRELYQRPPRLMEKWHRWLLRQFPIETQYHVALYHSLVTLCSRCDRVRYGRCDVPLLHEWLELACHVFSQRLHTVDAGLVDQQLRRHIGWIEARQHTGLYHPWHDYRVADCVDALWIHSEQRYIVSSLWLLQCDIKRENYCVRGLGRGRVSLDAVGFDTLLVQLYRLVLSDLAHLLCSVQAVCSGGDDDVVESVKRELAVEGRIDTETVEPLQRTLHTQSCADLYAFQLASQNYTSPVMRALVKQHEQQDALAEKRGPTDRRTIASTVPDIEDLAKLAPPCLQAVLQQDWCKNWDRYNGVAWLYDASYSRDQIVQYMCRNVAKSGSDESATLVGELYDACASPPDRRWRAPDGGLSVPCGTVINSFYETGNVLRCPYEEDKNGPQRRKHHSEAEKQLFQAQCASAGCLRRTTVAHPLDFVLDKINKDKFT